VRTARHRQPADSHPAATSFPARTEIYKHADLTEQPDAKILYVAVSSDRGLCGGIHSSISKATRKALEETPGALAVLGDKPKAQLSRVVPDAFKVSFNQIGKDIPTFAEAAAIADEIVTKAGEWDQIRIIYNKYISAISYEASTITVVNKDALSAACGSPAVSFEASSGEIYLLFPPSFQPASKLTRWRRTSPRT
jgi:F-type H+-transporting ATPase subunit gamma